MYRLTDWSGWKRQSRYLGTDALLVTFYGPIKLGDLGFYILAMNWLAYTRSQLCRAITMGLELPLLLLGKQHILRSLERIILLWLNI